MCLKRYGPSKSKNEHLYAETQFTPAAIYENLPIVVEILASRETNFETITGEVRLTYPDPLSWRVKEEESSLMRYKYGHI